MTTITTVGAILSAAHRRADGPLHGHTWEVWATWPGEPRHDCSELQMRLRNVLKPFDHSTLEDRFSDGENLAKAIGERLLGCIRVDLKRPGEMIIASWMTDE